MLIRILRPIEYRVKLEKWGFKIESALPGTQTDVSSTDPMPVMPAKRWQVEGSNEKLHLQFQRSDSEKARYFPKGGIRNSGSGEAPFTRTNSSLKLSNAHVYLAILPSLRHEPPRRTARELGGANLSTSRPTNP